MQLFQAFHMKRSQGAFALHGAVLQRLLLLTVLQRIIHRTNDGSHEGSVRNHSNYMRVLKGGSTVHSSSCGKGDSLNK